jgi:hypothetical protein
MCVPGTGTDDGGRTVKMVPFYTNADHSLDITTSVQALRQEVEPKSREKRLIIWWPVHITYRILTASHQPKFTCIKGHSCGLTKYGTTEDGLACRRRCITASC